MIHESHYQYILKIEHPTKEFQTFIQYTKSGSKTKYESDMWMGVCGLPDKWTSSDYTISSPNSNGDYSISTKYDNNEGKLGYYSSYTISVCYGPHNREYPLDGAAVKDFTWYHNKPLSITVKVYWSVDIDRYDGYANLSLTAYVDNVVPFNISVSMEISYKDDNEDIYDSVVVTIYEDDTKGVLDTTVGYDEVRVGRIIDLTPTIFTKDGVTYHVELSQQL